jgi:hypothetical protein
MPSERRFRNATAPNGDKRTNTRHLDRCHAAMNHEMDG